jgi:limonene-1,2-epoxide hydrolase
MSTEAESIISEFCKSWSRLNLDQIMDFFTDDAVYHNIPMKPAAGKDTIRKTIQELLKGTTWLEFKILHTASSGSVVFNERVDSFEVNGKRMSLPVVGVFETTANGKIKAWRDYFDMKMFTDQMK